MEILGDGNINYITGQYYADSALCYGNCASHSSFALGSGSISGFPGALYKESSNACEVFDEMPSSVYRCTQAQYGFNQIPIAVPSSPGIINPKNAQPIRDHRMHGEISEQYGTSGYACAFLSEINTSEQKPHHATETQSICDMLAHIQAKLKTMSENLSQDLKHMKSWESKQPDSSQPNPSTQEAINMSDEMPVYDVYEDVTACRSRIHPTVDIIEAEQVEVKEDSGNPRISPERPTNEKKPDNEGIFLCVNKASYNTFGEEAADFIFPHGPVIHADRSIKLTNEKSSQAAHMLFVQGATVHCTDESSEINIKKPDVLIKKHDITSPCDLNNDKEVPIVLKYQLPLSSTTNTWDPGVLNIIDMMLDKYTLLNQVQFGQ